MMIKFWFFFNDVIFSDFKDDIFESSLIVELSFFFLRSMQTLCNCHSSFSIIPSAVFGQTGKSFFEVRFVSCSCRHVHSKSGTPHWLDTQENYCVYVLKFRMCEYGVSCALEINSNSGSKQGHVESCPSITPNIISWLLQCLWPTNLAWRWLTIRGSHP